MTSARRATTLLPGIVALTFTALLALGCAAAPGGEAADTPGGEPSSVPGGSLVELQTGLPTGNPPAWYTAKLEELDYEVASLRYERSDLLAYEVGKGETAFSIQLALDPEAGTANRIEIQPTTPGAVAELGVPSEAPAAEPAAGGPAADSGATPADPPADPVATPADPPSDPVTTPADRPEIPPAPEQPRTTAEPAPAPAPEPAARIVALPAGTFIPTLLNDPLDSGRSEVGDRFSMIVPEPVSIAGIEVLPAGSRIWGYVADVEGARRPNSGGRIVLKADIIEAHGNSVDFEGLVTAEGERMEGEGSVREDLKEIAVGAGVGGLVGGLLGGKKGVLAGILIGGGGTFVATKGEEVRLAPDTPLYVELREEVRVSVPR